MASVGLSNVVNLVEGWYTSDNWYTCLICIFSTCIINIYRILILFNLYTKQ